MKYWQTKMLCIMVKSCSKGIIIVKPWKWCLKVIITIILPDLDYNKIMIWKYQGKVIRNIINKKMIFFRKK